MSSVNKGRGKYRFNIIDVLLLLVIALSVASILFLYFYDGKVGEDKADVEQVDIIFTVSRTELPAILRGKINMGDSVLDADGGTALGTVIDVEYTDSVYTGYDSESGVKYEEIYPGKIDVKVRISAKAVIDENGMYNINGFVLNMGKEADLRFPYYTGRAVCVSVSEVSE